MVDRAQIINGKIIQPLNGNGHSFIAWAKYWMTFLLLVGAFFGGLSATVWYVARPAVDSVYYSAAKGAALEERLDIITNTLVGINIHLEYLRGIRKDPPPAGVTP